MVEVKHYTHGTLMCAQTSRFIMSYMCDLHFDECLKSELQKLYKCRKRLLVKEEMGNSRKVQNTSTPFDLCSHGNASHTSHVGRYQVVGKVVSGFTLLFQRQNGPPSHVAIL